MFNKVANKRFTKQDFDKEYSTQYLKEMDYLTSKGIMCEFVKTTEKGVRTYKYKKTKELFLALVDFYGKLNK